MSLKQTEDGALMLRIKSTPKKYTAKELNAMCDFNAPMPQDLVAWDNVGPMGNEAAIVDLPIAYNDPIGDYEISVIELFANNTVTKKIMVK